MRSQKGTKKLQRGKTRVTNWQLVLALNLIGWESGSSFLSQSQRSETKPKKQWTTFDTKLKITKWFIGNSVSTRSKNLSRIMRVLEFVIRIIVLTSSGVFTIKPQKVFVYFKETKKSWIITVRKNRSVVLLSESDFQVNKNVCSSLPYITSISR